MLENDACPGDLSDLARAAVQDDIDLVLELTSEGHSVIWEPFPFDETALHIAADNGNAEMILILLDAGGAAYLDSVGDGMTPLGMAVKKGHVRAVETLLSRGASVNARDEPNVGDPPLSDAVDNGDEEMVRLLLSAGADPDIPGWMTLSPLDRAQRRYETKQDFVSRRILVAVLQAASNG
jgi:ankyrin repeat protein